MATEPLFNLKFEPDDTSFVDPGDQGGSLYSLHASRPVAVNDGRFISAEDIRSSNISIYLKIAQHGTHDGKPATLLLFEFKFFTPKHKNRIKYASIDIELKSTATPSPPHIYSFCPHHIVGDETKRTTTTEANFGVSASGGIRVSAGASRSEEIERPSRFTLVSRITKPSSDGSQISGVKWILTENESTKGGMPHILPIALIVHRKVERCNFIAKIDIAAKCSPNLSPNTWFGMRAYTPRPITVDVKKEIGPPVGLLEGIDLETLVDLPDHI